MDRLPILGSLGVLAPILETDRCHCQVPGLPVPPESAANSKEVTEQGLYPAQGRTLVPGAPGQMSQGGGQMPVYKPGQGQCINQESAV